MPSLEDLALFIDIVDAGSLAAAARLQGCPKSTVSRRLTALEERLQAPLLQRNTRTQRLTEAGHRLYERCRPLVLEAREAEAEVLAGASEPEGVLRVTATGAFGRVLIGPLLGDFLARHRRLRANLELLDRRVNLIEEGFDVAIRMGRLEDSSLVGRKLCDIERVLVAAPACAQRPGLVAQPQDLADEDCLVSSGGNAWRFRRAGQTISMAPRGRVASNQLDVLHSAVVRGCGVALLPRYLVAADLEAGRVVPLFPEVEPLPGAAHALWAARANVAPRVRLFVDFLVEHLDAPGVTPARGGAPSKSRSGTSSATARS